MHTIVPQERPHAALKTSRIMVRRPPRIATAALIALAAVAAASTISSPLGGGGIGWGAAAWHSPPHESSPIKGEEHFGALGKARPTHWDFETGDLQGWRVVSGDLGPQPTHNDNDRWGGNFAKQGRWFIGTCEVPGGGFDDARTGEIRSPTFASRSRFIRLLVGGGADRNSTYVALIRAGDGQELKRASGHNAEAMTPVLWEVSADRGAVVYLKIVDRATGGWGHINVDDIRELTPQEEAEVLRQEAQAKQARAERIARFKASLEAPARSASAAGATCASGRSSTPATRRAWCPADSLACAWMTARASR